MVGGAKMVDSREALESEFVSVDLVKQSMTKKMVIVDPGRYEDAEYQGEKQKRLTLGVNIDGKLKRWRPNRESVENMQVIGADTMSWIGKLVDLVVEKRAGRETVIARPNMADFGIKQPVVNMVGITA
jgi:hypothetical protein